MAPPRSRKGFANVGTDGSASGEVSDSDGQRPAQPAAKKTKAGAAIADKKIGGGKKHEARKGKGNKWCRGCKAWLALEAFATNQGLHFACKSARENLQRIAKRQKQLAWFYEAEGDDDKFAVMIANYADRTSFDAATEKRGRTKLMCSTLKTAVEASTELIKDDVGEMMCEIEFIDWSKTPKGGMLDPLAAKTKWDSMVQMKKA